MSRFIAPIADLSALGGYTTIQMKKLTGMIAPSLSGLSTVIIPYQ